MSGRRHDDPQSQRADVTADRRLHADDLAIHAHELVGAPRLDPDFCGREFLEVLGLPQPPQERAQREKEKAERTFAPRHVEAQNARVERGASPYIQPIHYVRIVSDEDEGRATNIVVVLHPYADEEEAIAQERAPGCDRERQPLASSQTLLNRFTATDDGRI